MITDKPTPQTVPLWRDDRVLKLVFQVLIIALVVGLYGLLFYNLNFNLQRTGLQFSFDFLNNSAGFSIGETPIDYSPQDQYTKALWIGLLNTLRVILVGFVMTTLVGILVGVASFSENWLVRQLSVVYVEIIRNTPLLLQLIFWYFVVFLSLPRPREPLELPGPIFMSKAGMAIPWPPMTGTFWLGIGVIGAGAIVAYFLWTWRTKLMVEQGASGQPQLVGLIAIAVAGLAILIFGLGWEGPQQLESGQIKGGLKLSVEYASVFFGLVIYTAAFIAEIVRGGIQAVSSGQWEAARSLGLQPGLVMRLVVFPQALQVIIPPLNSQYMNLAKNSSLALVIGYPDMVSVAYTTLNQTGRPLEVFIILMSTYLLINIVISIVMNQVNRLVQVRER